tara:strand:- start:552 stop:1637 length:1086 start_codon:yes stop_codon:yes gene_type:complete
MKAKFVLFFFIILVFIELIAQSIIFLAGENKYSIIIKPFSNQLSTVQTNYKISWDYKNNKMKPGKYLTEDGIAYNINSKGFRGGEFNNVKTKKRIISLGGSTTIGLESSDEMTYPAQLEKFLKVKNLNYEVLNMGFGSKSLNYIKSLFFSEVYEYNPDIIIIYSNRNSIMYDGGSIEPLKLNNRFINFSYYLQENIMTYRIMIKAYKRILNYNLKSNYLKSPISNNGISEEYLRTGYTNSLIEIIEFCKERKIKVYLVKQAYMFEKNIINKLDEFKVDELIELYKKDYFKKKYSLDEETNFWSVMGTILNKKIDELKFYKNVVVVDPINTLINSKKNFKDYLHLTPVGNGVLAGEISKKIN